MTKRPTPERDEIIRILKCIRSDVGEMRRVFERLRARLDEQQPPAGRPTG